MSLGSLTSPDHSYRSWARPQAGLQFLHEPPGTPQPPPASLTCPAICPLSLHVGLRGSQGLRETHAPFQAALLPPGPRPRAPPCALAVSLWVCLSLPGLSCVCRGPQSLPDPAPARGPWLSASCSLCPSQVPAARRAPHGPCVSPRPGPARARLQRGSAGCRVGAGTTPSPPEPPGHQRGAPARARRWPARPAYRRER